MADLIGINEEWGAIRSKLNAELDNSITARVWVHAKLFGLDASKSDNTAALQAGINAVKALGGGTLYIPTGYYRFQFLGGTSGLSTILIDADNVSIVGDGRSSILTVRSPAYQVPYFFTFKRTGLRGQGGGISNICFEGNSQLQWSIGMDSWRAAAFSNIWTRDVFGGVLDAYNDQTSYGENILVDHFDYIPSSATNACFAQFGVRFRAGSAGSWTECVVRDSLFVNVWDAGVLLDGATRCHVRQTGAACNSSSSNTIDGLTKTGIKNAVRVTNTVTNPSTADTGQHIIEAIYMESHTGTETYTDNVAVLIDTPAGQTVGLNRFNIVSDIDISYDQAGGAPGIFRVTNTSATAGLTSFNRFRGNRRAINNTQITIGPNVNDTYLELTPNRGQLSKILDQGNRTFVNGARNYAYSGLYPDNNIGLGQVDVGFVTRDTVTGRVCWQDRNNVPVLIGPRPGVDVVSPYGAQRITQLATPAAPSIVSGNPGSTSWSYYVVAIDKDGNKSPPGPAGTISNGAASLSGSNRNTIIWTPVDGAVKYDLLRGSTSQSVALGLTTCFYQDSAASTSAYTPSAASPKGTLTVDDWIQIGSSGPRVFSGAGTPEGSLTAQVASMYLRTDGGAGTCLYVKESGTGNTGWVAK